MDDEFVVCTKPGCGNVLQKEIVERYQTGGWCMACVDAKEAEERRAFVKANRRTVDPYEGITDPVELLQIFHRQPRSTELVVIAPPPRPPEQLYTGLTAAEVARLVVLAVQQLEAGNLEPAMMIARSLASLSRWPIDPLQEALFRRDMLDNGHVFRGASSSLTEAMLDRITSRWSSATTRLKLLCALIWIENDEITKLLAGWRRNRPRWASSLYVGPDAYSYLAGWELTPEGTRRRLWSEPCVWFPERDEAQDTAPIMGEPSDDNPACEHCGYQLAPFLDLGVLLLTCEHCVVYRPIFMRTGSGATRPEWHVASQDTGYRPPRPPSWKSAAFGLPAIAASPYRYVDRFGSLAGGATQAGGLPLWVQDAEYPQCPDCRRHMIFVGQVDGYPARAFNMGMAYGFHCASCRITATTCQTS